MNDTQTSQQRILVVTGPTARHSPLIDLLKQHFEVIVAESMDAAMHELRAGNIDAVFSDSADFLPLERAIATQQSGLILDTIGEGICIADENGQILWANRRMKQWSEPIRDRVRHVCQEAWSIFVNQTTPAASIGKEEHPTHAVTAHASPNNRSRKFSFSIDESQYFELFCSPVIDASRKISQVVAICWDATSGRRLQQRIDAIDQAGRELVRLEGEAISKLDVPQRLQLLEEKIIKLCRQLMHFDHFAIRLLDRKTNKLEIMTCVGMPTEASQVELFAQPEGNGISGYVASTGRSYICSDVHKDPRYVLGLNNAGSSLTVPLMLHDRVIGIFNIESQHVSNFTEDDRQFAEIFGRYVAVAINILNLLQFERFETTGRLASDVTAEIAGPLNDITSETTLLMDDYIGNDEMRKRLQLILDNVSKIRQSVREVASGSKTVLGAANAGGKTMDPILNGKRILVADDEQNIRQTIADLLSRYGCVVDIAKDGAEACAFISGEPRYDLILSDIKMPHKNGYEIYQAAQKLGHKPPVILMTGFGYDPAHSIVNASKEGLAAVLFKPFKVDQLLNEVRKAVQSPKK